MGYYLEYSTVIIGYFDTILSVTKLNDYHAYFHTAKLLNYYYEVLTKDIPEKREKYKKKMREARKFCLVQKKKNMRSDEVSNGKILQRFLNDKINKPRVFAAQYNIPHVSLYRILNGEKKAVRMKSLIPIVQSLELELSFDNPREINYILLCMKEDKLFSQNCEQLRKLTSLKRKQLILRGIFIQIPDDAVDCSKLLSLAEDAEKLINHIGSDYRLKRFINTCIEPNYPYYKGRDDLFNILLKAIGDEKISELIDLYTSVKKPTEVEQLNIYFREYARYSTTNWVFDVEEVLKNRFSDPDYGRIEVFCEHLNLSVLFGYVCTWFFEGAKRDELIEIIAGKKV